MKRREAKSKGEKERYKHLNAEFQRISRRDKKAFLSDQCKELEENNRMGKTRDLLKKIRVTKGTFHAKMGSIKDRNGMDLTEAEDIKKRWQEYTERKVRKGKLLSHVRLFATPWTVTYQAPLSMGFSRQECWSGCCSFFQGIFLTQGLNPGLLH